MNPVAKWLGITVAVILLLISGATLLVSRLIDEAELKPKAQSEREVYSVRLAGRASEALRAQRQKTQKTFPYHGKPRPPHTSARGQLFFWSQNGDNFRKLATTRGKTSAILRTSPSVVYALKLSRTDPCTAVNGTPIARNT